MSEPMSVLVTGGAGFIGSHVVDTLMSRSEVSVTVLDKLTYAGNVKNLDRHQGNERFAFVQGDIADAAAVEPLVAAADRIVNMAADTHVDRSIADPAEFVRTNVVGVYTMLEACKRLRKPMLHVSTDEVYGSTMGGAFGEDDSLRPNSPYSATKAAGDLACRAYSVTYGLPVTVVRGNNAYGPRQHPEKAIPTFTLAALAGRHLPVYGNGSNRREWLHVMDFARAILRVLDAGEAGQVYNIGGGHEISNIQLARMICKLTDAPEELIEYVKDRPGHDLRYSLTWLPLATLGWRPTIPFTDGMREVVDWYREHEGWARELLESASR
jgi:dTDP-glucose 4,6-dehydratase